MLVRQHFPQQTIHLSVQANAVNWATVKFWESQGVSRVILSRELSLEEIGEIREQVPGMELEVFVHGALCMAYSGRCLLSGYINKRDPNQGTCTNACRWEYKTHEAKEDELGNSVHLYEPIAVQQVEAQGNRPWASERPPTRCSCSRMSRGPASSWRRPRTSTAPTS